MWLNLLVEEPHSLDFFPEVEPEDEVIDAEGYVLPDAYSDLIGCADEIGGLIG